jgi:uncharacterized protein YndB with AHSA1/START domain
MIAQEGQIVIDRPVEEVFTYLSNPENHPQWEKVVVESKLMTNGPMRVGSKFKEQVKLMGPPIEVVCTITEYEYPRVVAFRSDTSSKIQYEARIHLEPVGNSTRLTFKGTNQFGGVWKLLEPILGGEMKKELEEALKNPQAAAGRARPDLVKVFHPGKPTLTPPQASPTSVSGACFNVFNVYTTTCHTRFCGTTSLNRCCAQSLQPPSSDGKMC